VTTWQLVKMLSKNTTVYWYKLMVFLGIVFVCYGTYFLFTAKVMTNAAYAPVTAEPGELIGDEVLDIIVTEDGHVLTETKNLSSNLKVLPNNYELSVLVIDKPGAYVESFKAVVHLPGNVDATQIKQRTYAVHGVESYKQYLQDPQTLVYEAKSIDPQASFTIVAELPLSILTPLVSQKTNYYLTQIPAKTYIILAVLLPLITLIVMFVMIVRRRQDQFFYKSKKIINLPPNDSPPAIAGALMDGKVGSREIAATLIDLAQRQYLFINRHQNGEFSFGKRKSLNLETLAELHEFERVLLSKIFEPDKYKSTGQDVQMRIGRHIFSKKIAQVYLNIYNEATKLGYFVQNPAVIHMYWRYAGIGMFFLSLVGFFYTAFLGPDPKYLLFSWIGQMAASAVIINLSDLMPTRSIVGTTALRQWTQFKQYLELDRRIEGGATIGQNFNRFLPYALVFGCEKAWTNRFSKETFFKPDWYESDMPVVTLEVFAEELFPLINYVGESLDDSHDPTVA
jgi:hypothetical protein